MNTIHSAEQQLNLALQQNEAQQRMISHISERLAAMEEAGKIGDEKVQLLINQLNSAALAAADVASLAAAAKSNHSPTPLRYKAANPSPFSGQPDTLQPWIHQVATHLHLADIVEPTTQYLVATQFLASGPLTWVQTLSEVNTWEQLKKQLTSYYRPLHQELRARDALHLLRQRGSVDDYAKSFNNLIIKVPGMTLEENLYISIKGFKTNIQISVAMQDPTTVEQAKILAASADGILSQQRRSPPSGPFVSHGSPFIARPEPMEIGAVVQRRNRLDPDEFKRRRAGRLCYACGKAGHCAFEHAADGSPPAGN
jgi:Ty3 transposon capsid-like protein